MDQFSSLRRSFKSSSSSSYIQPDDDQQPILFEHKQYCDHSTQMIASPDEVIVKINDEYNTNDNIIHDDNCTVSRNQYGGREFTFDSNNNVGGEDPPTRLIGQFLEQQRASGGEMALDMDLEMEELRGSGIMTPEVHYHRRSGLPPLPPDIASRMSSRNLSRAQSPDVSSEMRVSFQERRRRGLVESDDGSSDTDDDENEDDHDGYIDNDQGSRIRGQTSRATSLRDNAEVLRCTSNRAFDRAPTLSRTRTNRSRLMDPPSDKRFSGRMGRCSGPIPRSGLLGKDEDEDDVLFGEDLPEEYKKEKMSTLIVLEWVSLVLLIAAFVCSLTVPWLRGKKLWKLMLWKWEVLVLVLICGRLVSGWLIRVIVFLIERNFLLRKRVLYFVYGLKKAVRNCIWLGLVLLTWHFLFDSRVRREANTEVLDCVTKILVCFLIGAVIWFIKTLIVKVLASSFHVKAFFDRIQESLFNQFVIETLSGPPSYEILHFREDDERTLAEVQMLQNAGAAVPPDLRAIFFPAVNSPRMVGSGPIQKSPLGRSGRLSGPMNKKQEKERITIDHLHKLNQKNVSAWNMKRLMRIVRSRGLTTLDEQLLDSTQGDESIMQIRSEVEAKAAARKIFRNVAAPRAKYVVPLAHLRSSDDRYIYLENLMRFMQEDKALKTMSLFEGASETERISKSALKNWVVNAFRERRALALTLNDTKTAVNKLHHMVNILVCIIILVISLIILNIATSKFLVLATSQVVLVAFVFGNTCKNIFESIIFLFVVHPFDVGDRCEIDGVQMVVEEMNILTTVFLRFDNNKIVYPNSVLLTKPINNFYRSPDMGDAVEFQVHILTPPEKIALMRQRILSYIENKKEHWHPTPLFVWKDIENLNLIRFAVWLQHRMNYQDMAERWLRRAQLVEECIKIFRELDLEYRVYTASVDVRSMPPVTFSALPP
ncbi:hypothetical protein Droror1_Dr00001289 [Drosera rotundifolia]